MRTKRALLSCNLFCFGNLQLRAGLVSKFLLLYCDLRRPYHFSQTLGREVAPHCGLMTFPKGILDLAKLAARSPLVIAPQH